MANTKPNWLKIKEWWYDATLGPTTEDEFDRLHTKEFEVVKDLYFAGRYAQAAKVCMEMRKAKLTYKNYGIDRPNTTV
jgi:hypothetical protein